MSYFCNIRMSWSTLVQSSSIPMLSSKDAAAAGVSTEEDLKKNEEQAPVGSSINRSMSFDTRRQVWAAVEKQWARLTLDESLVSPTNAPIIKYDQDVQEQPLYQRIRSWLTSSPSSPNLSTYLECPILTKVKSWFSFKDFQHSSTRPRRILLFSLLSFFPSFLPSFLPSFFLSLFHFLPICFDLDSFCLSECISITAGSQLKRAELLLHKLCSNNVAYFDDVMLVQRCQIGSAYLGRDSAGFRRRTVSTSLLKFASCMSSDVVKTLLVALDRKCADAGSLQQSQTVDGDALPDCHSFDIRRSWRQERNLGTIICSTVCRFIWIEFFYFHCRVVKCGPGPADARLYRTEAPAIDGRSAVANTL